MKLLFLHGAVKNSGDFLISYRSQCLIRYIVAGCEIDAVWEGEPERVIREHLKGKDGVIFGGGPFFTHHIHPEDIPFVRDLSSVDIPMINIGGGWFGIDNRYATVTNYEMDDTSISLLKRIETSAGCLSCRDWYTVDMLKEKGFKAEMHGCPAWYDIQQVATSKLRTIQGFNKICISDPANLNNLAAAVKLIELLKNNYPTSKLIFVFHRGTWEKEEGKRGEARKAALASVLEKNKIKWIDISGSHEGFSVYDDCDLHIGFRVHAHIYNLSKRNRTILLEEDGRGAGVNEALGLSSIHAYDYDDSRSVKQQLLNKIGKKQISCTNEYLNSEILRYIEHLNYTSWIEYDLAFNRMQFYYEKLCSHISRIKEW